jgi:glycosyltransferase involved in cell wall biosynthesis
MHKILVIGQTPPPYGGQAMMIRRMLDGEYRNAVLYHARMAFSKDMDELGRFRLAKLFHAFGIIAHAVYLRLRHGITVLYYPPAGAGMLPVLRDIALLLCIRWFFKRTIFHFHAAGLSELYPKLPRAMRLFFRLAYFEPDVAIVLSSHNAGDAALLQSRSTLVIPNGIEDEYVPGGRRDEREADTCNILFVGVVQETKGVLVLIDAVERLRNAGARARLKVVGKFSSRGFEERVRSRIARADLEGVVEFTGVLTGKAKHQQYLWADVFCLPTFFENESFGLVVVEAMQFGVPVVASRWRGLQSVITDGVEGFLVPAKDDEALADRLGLLVHDPALRKRMGEKGRERYLREFTTDKFYRRMDECFGTL